MNFKEYLEFYELEEEISEGIGSTLAGILDAGVSGLGTIGKQGVRGGLNTGIGALRTGVEGIGSVFGSPKSREKSKKNLKSAVGQIGKGMSQLVGAVPSGLVRGFEAGRDPFSKMKDDDGSDWIPKGWGETMGIRKSPKPINDLSWEELIKLYNSTKEKKEKVEILSVMKKNYRKEYDNFVLRVKISKAMKILELNELNMQKVLENYRRLSKIHHPDKGGSAEEFKKISEAFVFLKRILEKRMAS